MSDGVVYVTYRFKYNSTAEVVNEQYLKPGPIRECQRNWVRRRHLTPTFLWSQGDVQLQVAAERSSPRTYLNVIRGAGGHWKAHLRQEARTAVVVAV